MTHLNLWPLFLKINCNSISRVPIIMTFLQTHILADQCYIIHHHGAASNCFKHITKYKVVYDTDYFTSYKNMSETAGHMFRTTQLSDYFCHLVFKTTRTKIALCTVTASGNLTRDRGSDNVERQMDFHMHTCTCANTHTHIHTCIPTYLHTYIKSSVIGHILISGTLSPSVCIL
jgi:dihydroorotase